MKNLRDLLGALEPAAREPLEIRAAVLDAIEELVQPLGDGRRGLLHHRIVVRLLSADEGRRNLVRAVLTAEPGLRDAVVKRLEPRGCFVDPRLTIEVSADAPPEGAAAAGSEFEIVPYVEPAQTESAPAPVRIPRPKAKLILLGDAGLAREIEITADVFNVGRLREVRGKDRRPLRRNHLYFGEDEATVSRQHAHIRYFPESGEFRLYDDGSSRGTRIFSNGEPIDVPPGRGRGEKLHSGDEIYFGTVCLLFEIVGS